MASEPNLDALRGKPDPEFADRLRARLRQQPMGRTRPARGVLAKFAKNASSASTGAVLDRFE